MSEIIEFQAAKFFKESEDEFLEFAGVIEKHFRYQKTNELILKRILYSLKYVFNICSFWIEEKQEKQNHKELVINFLKQMLKILET